MRICHLLAADTTEDDLITIGQLLAALDAHHFEQRVASVDRPTADRAHRALGLAVRSVELRWGGYAALTRQKWIAKWRPNLLHLWSSEPALMDVLRGFRRPGIVVRGCPNGLAAHMPAFRTERLFRRATIVCDSASAREAIARLGNEIPRCVVVPPGVDASDDEARPALSREAAGLPADEPVLLTPGPPSREGGQYYAVWAAALLRQVFRGIRLIVPGDSPERARLERFVRSFRMPQILVCTGDRQPFRALMGLADVVVAPALTDAPTGPVVRAMAAGLPVVGSDVPALRERIDEATTGLLAPPGKPTLLAGAILRVLDDRELRDRLARAARQRAAEAYPLERFVRQYEAVYEQAFGRVRTAAGGDPS